MNEPSVGDGPPARKGVELLRGVAICGLVLTAGAGGGTPYALFRSALPLLAGLGFGGALAEAERTGRHLSARWVLHLALLWLAAMSSQMWGNREMMRTLAVAGGVMLVARRMPVGRLLGWAGATVAALAALAWSPAAWAEVVTSELGYALGVAWPREWTAVVVDVSLFVVGCASAKGEAIRVLGRWRGIALPLRAVGRMPLTTAAGQYAFAWALFTPGHAGGHPGPLGLAVMAGLLLAQAAFSAWWLLGRERGPVEQAAYAVRAAFTSAVRWAAGRARSLGRLALRGGRDAAKSGADQQVLQVVDTRGGAFRVPQ